jgi:hypothetical protein
VATHEDNRFFTKDDVLIVFEVALYEGKGMYHDEWVTHAPDSYAREHRMQALAEKLGTDTRWFSDADPEEEFHAHRTSLGGVIIKKKDIEAAASLIRENPKLYRIGKEFYSADEIKKNNKEFVANLKAAYEKMGKYGSHEQEAMTYLERIKQVYGREAFATAKDVYKEWVAGKRRRGEL